MVLVNNISCFKELINLFQVGWWKYNLCTPPDCNSGCRGRIRMGHWSGSECNACAGEFLAVM